ncbi:MAG: hypothetical protein KIT73_04640 [Burkholderiales bacterium]|nr:hypothetical protein [Burkholderiales bacterium]
MRIKGHYVGAAGTTYFYDIKVFASQGAWDMEGELGADGRIVATLHDTLESSWSCEAELEVLVYNCVTRYVEGRFPPVTLHLPRVPAPIIGMRPPMPVPAGAAEREMS